MICKIGLCDDFDELEPILNQLSPEDRDWLLSFDYSGGCLEMSLSELTRLLPAINEIDEIFFEVR